ALLEDVAAETPEAGDAVGEVDLLRFLEFLPLRRRHHGRAHGDDVLVIEALVLDRRYQLAAHAHHREAADLEVQIRGAAFDRNLQQIVDMYAVKRPGLPPAHEAPLRRRGRRSAIREYRRSRR